jgi:hypothetical protein
MTPRETEALRQRLLDGIAAGCVATLVMTALILAAPALGGGRLPLRVAHALTALLHRPLAAAGVLGLHLAYGSLAGGLFAAGARHISVASGVLYALGLWAVAVTVYAPLLGLGFVSWHLPGLAALTLPAHLLYGTTLGALVPRGTIIQPLEA